MSIGEVSDRTGTDHGSKWYSIEDRALGVVGAWFDDRAGFDALVVNADELARALGILGALVAQFSWLAERVRIALEVLGTATGGHVIGHEAVAVARTRVAQVLTRIDAARVATAKVARAVLVGGALGAFAKNLRVTQVAG